MQCYEWGAGNRKKQICEPIMNSLVFSFTLCFTLVLNGCALLGQQITETIYMGRPHFRIETAAAVFLFDRAGGGFSSIRDSDGLEWIGFKSGNGQVPGSAAADFRGLPNLVFRGQDNGCGHPGFDLCVSEKTASNQILTRSRSGLWEWYWTFTRDGAILEVTATDSARNYWFLYEGTPGGTFAPGKQFWGNSMDGYRTDAPPIGSGETGHGNWDWAYFGLQDVNRCLAVIQLTPDELDDSFSYMGSSPEGISSPEGMVVFGLGRVGAEPLMSGLNRFFVGFLEQCGSPEEIASRIKKLALQYSY